MEIPNVTGSCLKLLREQIVMGELLPGQKLNESLLSAQFGVSRPPLREAFRLLEKDHMAVNIPRKGTYVTELSVEGFTELAQVRKMIEHCAIDLLRAADTRDTPEVNAALDRSLNLPVPWVWSNSRELLGYIATILDFHYCLVEASANSLLTEIYRSISSALARYQYLYFGLDDAVEHSREDHSRVVESLRKGEYDKAQEQLDKHIEYTGEVVKNQIFCVR